MTMIRRIPPLLSSLTLVVCMLPGVALAQSGDDLDVTMRMVVDEEELTDGMIQELQLPEPSAGKLPDSNGQRPGRAGDLREQGRGLGREISEEARGRREERSSGGPGKAPEFPPAEPPGRGENDRPGPGGAPDDRPGAGGNPGGRP
ncbi:MAG: hypothetical protein ACOCVV_12595 [Marinobacter sp.]